MQRSMKATINTDKAVTTGQESLAKKPAPKPEPKPKKDK